MVIKHIPHLSVSSVGSEEAMPFRSSNYQRLSSEYDLDEGSMHDLDDQQQSILESELKKNIERAFFQFVGLGLDASNDSDHIISKLKGGQYPAKEARILAYLRYFNYSRQCGIFICVIGYLALALFEEPTALIPIPMAWRVVLEISILAILAHHIWLGSTFVSYDSRTNHMEDFDDEYRSSMSSVEIKDDIDKIDNISHTIIASDNNQDLAIASIGKARKRAQTRMESYTNDADKYFDKKNKGFLRSQIPLFGLVGICLLDLVVHSIATEVKGHEVARPLRILRIFFGILLYEYANVRMGFRDMLGILTSSLAAISLLFMTVSIFAIMFVGLLEHKNLKNSDGNPYMTTFTESWWELFILSTTSNFPDIMMPAYYMNTFYAVLFVITVIILYFLLFNVVLAVVYEHYSRRLGWEANRAARARRLSITVAYDLVCNSGNRLPTLEVDSKQWAKVFAYMNMLPTSHYLSHTDEPSWRSSLLFSICDKDDSNTLCLEDFMQLVQAIKIPLYERKRLSLKYWLSLLVGGKYAAEQRREEWRDMKAMRRLNEQFNINLFEWIVTEWHHEFIFQGRVFRIYWFELFFELAIIANAITMAIAAEGYEEKSSETNRWNSFDFLIIGTSAMVKLVSFIKYHGESRVVSVLTVLRVMRLGKLFRHLKYFRNIFTTLSLLGPAVKVYTIMVILIFYVFAIIGMDVFGGLVYSMDHKDDADGGIYSNSAFRYEIESQNPKICHVENNTDSVVSSTMYCDSGYFKNNFNNLLNSYFTLFELAVVNNWQVIAQGFVYLTNKSARIYFLLFIVSVVYMMTNIFVAFIIDTFIKQKAIGNLEGVQGVFETKLKRLGLELQHTSIAEGGSGFRAHKDFEKWKAVEEEKSENIEHRLLRAYALNRNKMSEINGNLEENSEVEYAQDLLPTGEWMLLLAAILIDDAANGRKSRLIDVAMSLLAIAHEKNKDRTITSSSVSNSLHSSHSISNDSCPTQELTEFAIVLNPEMSGTVNVAREFAYYQESNNFPRKMFRIDLGCRQLVQLVTIRIHHSKLPGKADCKDLVWFTNDYSEHEASSWKNLSQRKALDTLIERRTIPNLTPSDQDWKPLEFVQSNGDSDCEYSCNLGGETMRFLHFDLCKDVTNEISISSISILGWCNLTAFASVKYEESDVKVTDLERDPSQVLSYSGPGPVGFFSEGNVKQSGIMLDLGAEHLICAIELCNGRGKYGVKDFDIQMYRNETSEIKYAHSCQGVLNSLESLRPNSNSHSFSSNLMAKNHNLSVHDIKAATSRINMTKTCIPVLNDKEGTGFSLKLLLEGVSEDNHGDIHPTNFGSVYAKYLCFKAINTHSNDIIYPTLRTLSVFGIPSREWQIRASSIFNAVDRFIILQGLKADMTHLLIQNFEDKEIGKLTIGSEAKIAGYLCAFDRRPGRFFRKKPAWRYFKLDSQSRLFQFESSNPNKLALFAIDLRDVTRIVTPLDIS
eukprot:UC4_evm1s1361